MAIALALGSGAALPAGALAKRAPIAPAGLRLVPRARRLRARATSPRRTARPGGGVTPLAEPGLQGQAPNATAAPDASAKRSRRRRAYSTTNVQEEGVDEPDVVKTDGATIFTVIGDTLYAVAATGPGAPRIAGSLKLSRSGGDLLLHGQRLLVIQSAGAIFDKPVAASARSPRRAGRGPDPHHRGRRPRPGGAEGRADADPRRPVRQRAPERRDRARRALLDAARLRGGRRARPRVGLAAALALRLADLRPPPHADDGRVPRRCAGRRRSRGSARSRSSPSTSTRACGRSTPTR